MPRIRQRFLAATLVALTVASAAPARAQPAGDFAGAQALLDEGNRAATAGDFAAALERFRAAYARYKSPNILLNIGTALRRLGRGPEAAVVYEKYLRDPGASPERAAEIRRAIGEIDTTVGRVTIGATDTGAHVWIDGSELLGFASGGTVRLAPGQHTVAAGRDAPLASEVIRVQAGEARSVFLRLPQASPPAPRVLVVTRPERRARRPRRAMGPLKITGVVFDVVGGLGLAGSIGAGTAALVIDHDASRHCLDRGPACEPRALELERDAQAASRAASILVGVGSGLLITGLILGAVDSGVRYDEARARSLPRVGCAPAPGGGFVTLGATW